MSISIKHARNLYIGTTVERASLTVDADMLGVKYYDTDTDEIYYWNGTAWVTSAPTAEFTIWYSDAPPETPSNYDDEFDDESLSSMWSVYDNGGLLTVSEDVTGLKLELGYSSGADLAGVYQAIQSGDFTYITKIFVSVDSRNVYAHIGLALLQGSGSSSDVYGIFLNALRTSYNQRITALYFTDYQTLDTEHTYEEGEYQDSFIYFRIRKDGSEYFFEWSKDGIGWRWLYTESSMPFTPTKIGIIVNCESSSTMLVGRSTLFRYKASETSFYDVLEGARINGFYS